jgi:hypothetical protein
MRDAGDFYDAWHADEGRMAQEAGAAPAIACLPSTETQVESTQDNRNDTLSDSRNVTIFLKIARTAAQTEAVDAAPPTDRGDAP